MSKLLFKEANFGYRSLHPSEAKALNFVSLNRCWREPQARAGNVYRLHKSHARASNPPIIIQKRTKKNPDTFSRSGFDIIVPVDLKLNRGKGLLCP